MHRSIVLAFLLLIGVPVRADQTIELGLGCSLNDAIRAANTNQPVGACQGGDPGHDHIYVHDTVKILEHPVEITESLAIVGDRDTSTLDGQGRFSFFHVGPGVNLHLQDLFMSNGYGTRDTGQARVDSGGRIGFSTVKVINCKGVKEIVAADDATVHFGHEANVCGKMEPFNPHRPILPLPGPNDDPPNKPKQKREPSARSALKPAVHTCEYLPEFIIVRAVAGTRSGIQCQAIDESGVGIQAVIDRGIITAVDIWGYVEPGVEVCLRGPGPLVFLDAAYAPRQVSNMASYPQGDMTCAAFNRAGSLVLVSIPGTPQSTTFPQALDGCSIRTTDVLNLRDAPAGKDILGLILPDVTVKAEARTPGWFRITVDGIRSWISADLVTPIGDCA